MAPTKFLTLSLMIPEPLDSLTQTSMREILSSMILKRDKSQEQSRMNQESSVISQAETTLEELDKSCMWKDIWVVLILSISEMPTERLLPQENQMCSLLEIKSHGSVFPKEMVLTKLSWKRKLRKKKREEKQANDSIFNVRLFNKLFGMVEYFKLVQNIGEFKEWDVLINAI